MIGAILGRAVEELGVSPVLTLVKRVTFPESLPGVETKDVDFGG